MLQCKGPTNPKHDFAGGSAVPVRPITAIGARFQRRPKSGNFGHWLAARGAIESGPVPGQFPAWQSHHRLVPWPFRCLYSTSALSLSPTWESRVRYTRPPQQVRWSSPRRLPCARCTGSSGSGCATGSQTTGPPTRQAFQRETIAGRIRQPPTQPMQTSPRQARIRSEAPPRKADFPAQSRRTA